MIGGGSAPRDFLGTPAVLLSADDYDTLQETITVLSDPELVTAHHEGQAAIEADDYLDADQLAHAMREAGRLPR